MNIPAVWLPWGCTLLEYMVETLPEQWLILAYISKHPHSRQDTAPNTVPDRILEVAEEGVKRAEL